MDSRTEPLNVGLFITRHPAHPTTRKIKVEARGYGIIWCHEGEDYEAMATAWIAKLKDWPEHLVNAYNVNGAG